MLIFLTVCFTSNKSGILPRRNLDWIAIKINNIDKEKDNYIDKKNFVFNTYKTAKYKGKQLIPIPEMILKVTKKFLKLNENDYL
jgi:hypothetical protein